MNLIFPAKISQIQILSTKIKMAQALTQSLALRMQKKGTFELLSSTQIPQLGFGTFELRGEVVRKSVTCALEVGYRHFDTAAIYKNEEDIGQILKESQIPRNELFITSKLGPADQGFDKALKSCEASLKKLGIDYLDLFLIHWPGLTGARRDSSENAKARKESWMAFEKLYFSGKCKAIGVSNYQISHLEELLSYSTLIPSCNQVEYHPQLYQDELHEFCKRHGILIEAYTPLGKGNSGQLLQHPTVQKLSKKYSKTPAQIVLRWGIQHEVVILPRSSNPDRIKENANVFDFELTKDDMKLLDSFEKNFRYCWDPSDVK